MVFRTGAEGIRALRRVAAYIIDCSIAVIFFKFLLPAFDLFVTLFVHNWAAYLSILLALAVPVIILGALVGRFGRTPGKWLLFLKVSHSSGEPIGARQGILREITKVVCFSLFFGIVWALYDLLTTEQTFYDQWLDCDVEDSKPSALSEIQKKFEDYMKPQR